LEKDKKRYYRFSQYLKERFGCRVHKVSIDAGFSCPDKDGKLSQDGCIYCDNSAFSFNTRLSPRPIETQIKEGMGFGQKRYGAGKFIVYFQAYTNTYAPLQILKQRYDTVRKFKDIVGISIGTRPDCVNEEVLDLIKSYASDYEVWVEYGLQSIHAKTLKFINRHHSYNDFLKALEMTRRRDLKICAHVIIGLPQENKKEILETARELGRLKIDGLKIHPLHVVKGTRLESMFKEGLYKLLKLDEYVNLATDFLEYLWPETVIQRITADCPPELLIAPLWLTEKNKVLKEIDNTLFKKDKFQGRFFKS